MTTTTAELLDAMLPPSLRRLLHDAPHIALELDKWATEHDVTLTASFAISTTWSAPEHVLRLVASYHGDEFATVDVSASLSDGTRVYVTDLYGPESAEMDDVAPAHVAGYCAAVIGEHLQAVLS